MVKKKPVTIAGSGSCIEVKQHSVMIEQALDRLQRLSVRRQGAYTIIMSGPRLDHDVDFSCPHCGAQYVVSYTKLPIANSDSVYCEVCRQRMAQWNSALRPFYRLVKRPDGIGISNLPTAHSQDNSRDANMRDTARHHAKIVDHLETALTLCYATGEPIVGNLIERALDEARASQVKVMPKPKPTDRR